MERTIEFEFDGQVYHLLLNAAALFDLYEKYDEDVLDLITGIDRRSFDVTVFTLAKLSQQGELLRRYLGEDPRPMLTLEQAARCLSPLDVIRARGAIRQAYAAGLGREQAQEEKEIDLGLLELRRAKKNGSPGRSICARLRSFFT